MSKFCPKCHAEYNDKMLNCPKDNLPLQKQDIPSTMLKKIDIYAAADEIEAQRIVSLFKSEGIKASHHVREIAQLPMAGDQRFIIKVPEEDLKKAKTLLEQARSDQIISATGRFL